MSPLVGAIVLLIVDIVFIIVAWRTDNGFLINTGFLVLGALLTIITTILIEIHQRTVRAKGVARILHAELADLVARCCFDSEAPWRQYWANNPQDKGFNVVRLRKFMPGKPIIFSSAASEVALLEGNVPLFLIQFYYRLDALRREIESIVDDATENTRMDAISTGPLKLIGSRFRQTLEPGLKALAALGPMVPNSSGIEASAIAAYDATRGTSPNNTLQDRIKILIEGSGA